MAGTAAGASGAGGPQPSPRARGHFCPARRHAPRSAQGCVLFVKLWQYGGKARALMQGRYHVTFEDIKMLAHPVLRHRILTNFHAESERVTTDSLIEQLLAAVPLPRSGL